MEDRHGTPGRVVRSCFVGWEQALLDERARPGSEAIRVFPWPDPWPQVSVLAPFVAWGAGSKAPRWALRGLRKALVRAREEGYSWDDLADLMGLLGSRDARISSVRYYAGRLDTSVPTARLAS